MLSWQQEAFLNSRMILTWVPLPATALGCHRDLYFLRRHFRNLLQESLFQSLRHQYDIITRLHIYTQTHTHTQKTTILVNLQYWKKNIKAFFKAGDEHRVLRPVYRQIRQNMEVHGAAVLKIAYMSMEFINTPIFQLCFPLWTMYCFIRGREEPLLCVPAPVEVVRDPFWDKTLWNSHCDPLWLWLILPESVRSTVHSNNYIISTPRVLTPSSPFAADLVQGGVENNLAYNNVRSVLYVMQL